MPGNPNLESVILEFLMEELGILGFRMRNPRHRIRNPGLSCIPLNGPGDREGDAFTSDFTKLVFIDDFLSLFGQRH